MGDIYAFGLNFKTAPVELRERLACKEEELYHILPLLKESSGVQELCLLSTCNRVELYAFSEKEGDVRALIDTFGEMKGLRKGSLDKQSFLLKNDKAVFHIFKVAASLDSMVVGEPQIVSQFKSSFRIAKELGTTGKILNRVFDKALRTSKRVRTETGISRNAVSISYAAVELAKRIFGDIKKARVLLVGAGEMGELAANYLKRLGAKLYITNRTYEKALKLAQNLEGNALRFEEMSDYLVDMDIVLVSTGARHHLLTSELMEDVMKRRSYEPMFIIDISVPRNVEPAVGQIEEVFLYDIDDLKQVVESNLRDRKREAQKGEIIVWDEVNKFMRWFEGLKVEPVILKIKDSVREHERESPYLRRVLFKAFKEIKRNPEIAPLMLKIFSEEVKGNVHRREELSHVYNRADGA